MVQIILSIFSSRLQWLKKQAEDGYDFGAMSLDFNTINILRLIKQRKNTNTLIWNYDKWLINKEYRAKFLREIGLAVDIMPALSNHGGGSSF